MVLQEHGNFQGLGKTCAELEFVPQDQTWPCLGILSSLYTWNSWALSGTALFCGTISMCGCKYLEVKENGCWPCDSPFLSANDWLSMVKGTVIANTANYTKPRHPSPVGWWVCKDFPDWGGDPSWVCVALFPGLGPGLNERERRCWMVTLQSPLLSASLLWVSFGQFPDCTMMGCTLNHEPK